MDDLIPVINKVLDISRTVDLPLDLPRIAVVGSQSAGKSSVLESFVGRDFLPRGAGLCTRCPLVLQLLHHANREYAQFSHSDVEFEDFHDVRDEIVRVTDQRIRKNDISNLPISLKIYSPNVANLTLVDLPGLIQLPGRGQESSLPNQIRKMVKKYIEPSCCLILAISAANSDLATSEGLQLAKEVDPNGERTIGVLTKLDLMDKGTDARCIINNEDFPLKLGYVGVVNRSQQDIMDDVGMESARRHEQKFIKEHYGVMADHMGTAFLQSTLTKLLQDHIYRSLPQLRKQIQAKLREWAEKSRELEQYNSNSCHLMITLLKSFYVDLKEDIEGVGLLVNMEMPSKGTQIKEVFHTWFPQQLHEIAFEENQLKREIEVAIENIYGNKTHVNPADAVLKAVLAKEIGKLAAPSLQAVDSITDLVHEAIEQSLGQLSEYQRLRFEVDDLMNEKVVEFSEEAKKQLRSNIEYNQKYINHRHADFRAPRPQQQSVSDNEEVWGGPLCILGMGLKRSGFWFVMTRDTLSWYRDATKRECFYRLPLQDLCFLRLKRPFYSKRPRCGLQHKNGSNVYRNWKMLGLSAETQDDLEDFLQQLVVSAGVDVTYDSLIQSRNGYTRLPSSSDFSISMGQEDAAWTPQSVDSLRDVETVHRYVQPYLKIVHKSQKDMLPKIIATEYIHKLTEFAETDLFMLVRDVDKLMQEPMSKRKYREETLEKLRALREAKQAISEF